MDRVSRSKRSEMMSRVRSKHTQVELTVRRFVHSLGFRYRLHAKDLPGSPDIVFRKRKKVIFVHGCFWHAHGCKKGQLPKSNLDFWGPKLSANVSRDLKAIGDLERGGWSVLVIWQCELKDLSVLKTKIEAFLLEKIEVQPRS